MVFFWMDWQTGTAKINSCSVSQCIKIIFFSEYFFFSHNHLTSDDFTSFLFKYLTYLALCDIKYLTYFALCDTIIFSINNNFFHVSPATFSYSTTFFRDIFLWDISCKRKLLDKDNTWVLKITIALFLSYKITTPLKLEINYFFRLVKKQ